MDDIREVGGLLRTARGNALLTQRALAARAGVSQSSIAAIERGQQLPSLGVLQTLFATMDLQLNIRLEPAFRDLDARLDEWAAADVDERVAMASRELASPFWLLMCLAGSGAVLTGAMGAAILGAPVPVDHLDALVPRDPAAMEVVSTALQAVYASSPVVGPAWPGVLASPEADPESVWYSSGPNLHVRLVDPAAVTDTVPVELSCARPGKQPLLVTPLWQIEAFDRTTARVLERMRSRHREKTGLVAGQ